MGKATKDAVRSETRAVDEITLPEEVAKEVGFSSLSFIRYDTREIGSLAQIAPALTDRCGIYILQFSNGERYVGQTAEVIGRYASHRRTWDDLVAVAFAPCEPDQLNELEVVVIRHEQKDHDLRNRKLTNLPGGSADLEIIVNDGPTIPLPWDRARRVLVRDTPPSTREARFWRLAESALYGSIRSLLQRYVREAIPAPVDSQGMWVLTALPSTHGGARLFTMSVGDTETVFGWQDDDDPSRLGVKLNVSDEDAALQRKLDACGLPISHGSVDYAVATHHPVRVITCNDASTASEVLAQDYVLDAAYRLNVVLMRKGSAPLRRYHNQMFAADVLTAAWRASGGAVF